MAFEEKYYIYWSKEQYNFQINKIINLTRNGLK